MSAGFAPIARYRRAANYLAAAQIYLKDNVLLEEPLRPTHIKDRLLGHWGTCPGINLVYAHLNRLVRERDANILLITGPGHGAAANLANLYLEGTLSEFYPDLTRDRDGLERFVRAFSWPGGFPSHLSPARARHHPRGGRAGLRAGDGVRRGPRQSGPDRRLHRGRWRGRDRSDRHRLAQHQVPRPGDLGRGAADPAPQRLQDLFADHLRDDDR